MGMLEARYADALLSLAASPHEADWADGALAELSSSFSQDAELWQFLLNPVAPSGARKSALRGCVEGRLGRAAQGGAAEERGPGKDARAAGQGGAGKGAKAAGQGGGAGKGAKAAAQGGAAASAKADAQGGAAASAMAAEEGRAAKTLADFLCLLVDKGRLKLVPGIAAAYHDAKAKSRNVLRISVLAPCEPGAPQLDAIREKYARRYGASAVELDFRAEPSLVGGIRVQAGDVRVDDTLAGRLAALRELVTANQANQKEV